MSSPRPTTRARPPSTVRKPTPPRKTLCINVNPGDNLPGVQLTRPASPREGLVGVDGLWAIAVTTCASLLERHDADRYTITFARYA
jgi:hypothetical protein